MATMDSSAALILLCFRTITTWILYWTTCSLHLIGHRYHSLLAGQHVFVKMPEPFHTCYNPRTTVVAALDVFTTTGCKGRWPVSPKTAPSYIGLRRVPTTHTLRYLSCQTTRALVSSVTDPHSTRRHRARKRLFSKFPSLSSAPTARGDAIAQSALSGKI